MEKIAKIKEAQEKLNNFRGSEINRNYWKGILANSFPKISEEKDGIVTEVEFMGAKFIRNN